MSAKEQLAKSLKLPPEAIQESVTRWASLMREGVLVELSVGRWRGEISLAAADLGLDPAAPTPAT